MSTEQEQFTQIIFYLQQILYELKSQTSLGGKTVFFEVITVGTTAIPLYPNSKVVKGGTLLNLSTTDTVTLGGSGAASSGKPMQFAAGSGFVLNPAAAAGQGGGTFNFANCDLSTITAITNTNTAQSLAIVYYT